jgi:NAD(P)-dependent dehydrogenase (short-subunit alcohol dehydrogenase family)
MESFDGKLAVVTGGGTGMGRELVVQLAARGCSVATCDVHVDTLADTERRALDGAPAGVRVSTHRGDVSDAAAMERFRDEVLAEYATDHLELVFNNAGIGGGGSFVAGDRSEWERTFGVCWGGVYNTSRAFLPLLVAADEGALVNTSSVNGFWAALGPGIPHTAYSTAKFAVKGFSEALIEDLRVNAPHVAVHVVMPGHIGTDILNNSRRIHRGDGAEAPDQLEQSRELLARAGVEAEPLDDDEVRALVDGFGDMFRDTAPMTAAGAATVILDGVADGRWRILVGDDAVALDAAVRADPEASYAPGRASFFGFLS